MNVIEITAEKKPAQDTIRLAAYCRVSSDSEDQLHSFAAQIRYYKDYERRHPQYRLVDIYADEGITGTCMDKRDDLHRLIRDCKKGLIDRIIVKSVSRFARNTQELLATIRFLKDIGVSVYFEEQGIDTDKLNSEMIVTFPGMAAQQESESISGNMRWSYKKRMESGDFNCCAPAYGFDLIDGNLVINETEAVVVRRIFSMYLQGYGKQAIADLAARNLVIVRLHTSGILNGSDYSAQSSEINNRISALRSERKKKLAEDEGDEQLDKLKELQSILDEYEPTEAFDEDLFHQIIEKAVVMSKSGIAFYLIGGLKLTEAIA